MLLTAACRSAGVLLASRDDDGSTGAVFVATLAFDTYKAVKALREAGFDDLQVEAVTEQISTAIGGIW